MKRNDPSPFVIFPLHPLMQLFRLFCSAVRFYKVFYSSTIDQQDLATVERIWPTAVAGKTDIELTQSASACHIGGPNSVNPGQILIPSTRQLRYCKPRPGLEIRIQTNIPSGQKSPKHTQLPTWPWTQQMLNQWESKMQSRKEQLEPSKGNNRLWRLASSASQARIPHLDSCIFLQSKGIFKREIGGIVFWLSIYSLVITCRGSDIASGGIDRLKTKFWQM